jgi:hypothetical protein
LPFLAVIIAPFGDLSHQFVIRADSLIGVYANDDTASAFTRTRWDGTSHGRRMTTSFILVFLKKSALRIVLVRTDNSELLSNA